MVARLICTYTRTGDLVIAFTHQHAVAQAADWHARKATLVVTDSHHQENLDRRLQPRLTPTRRAMVRVVAAHLARHAQLLERAPQTASMIMLRWLAEHEAPAGPSGRFDLVAAAARALKPGGHLCIEVTDVDANGRFLDHATEAIAVAQAAGLTYHQHIVAIHEHPSEQELPPGNQISALGQQQQHRRDHIDLYIFSNSGSIDA